MLENKQVVLLGQSSQKKKTRSYQSAHRMQAMNQQQRHPIRPQKTNAFWHSGEFLDELCETRMSEAIANGPRASSH